MPSTYLTANGKRELEVKPAYSWLGDKMRQAVSHDVICTVGCGGVECKFCVPEGKFDKQDFVIEGLFSNWVEPHFVAISRPSTRAMEKFHIVDQFLQLGVKSIVNLTTPGEHSNCGFELESSGFSYIPEDFMRRGVFFYNFPWPDFGTANNHELLDAVQVVDFAVSQGKVAVHCHAGKGRTGSLIACYFVYVHRVPASAAIFYVRNKRAGSIQTKGQVMMVKDFQTFLEHFWVIFPRMEPEIGLRTLETSLNLQNKILHGSERKFLKHTPKIVYVACKMLLAFAGLKATEEKFKLEGSLGEGSQFPPELEKIIDLYFERRLTALSNGIDRSFVHQNSEPVLGKGSFKSRSSVDLTDVGGKANERHNSEPPHRGMNPREHSRLSMHDKDQEMRLDDERDRSWQHVYPVESVISKVSDRKMESLQKRRTSVGSIDSTSKHIYDVSDKLENGTAARNGKVFPVEEILEALKSYDDDSVLEAVKLLEEEMNIAPRCWDLMLRQKDPKVVSVLLWDWFDQLKYSLLSSGDLEDLIKSPLPEQYQAVNSGTDSVGILREIIRNILKKPDATETILTLLRTVVHLCPTVSEFSDILPTMLTHLTQTGLNRKSSLQKSSGSLEKRKPDLWNNSLRVFTNFYYHLKSNKVSNDKNLISESLTSSSDYRDCGPIEDIFSTR